MSKYQKATDEELREAGFDPGWIMDDDPDQEGPYAVYKSFDETCPCCEGITSGWLILDLARAVAIGTTYFGDTGQCEAEEITNALNHAWLHGHDAGWGVIAEEDSKEIS